jgi:AcrR family transcriptional regulator
MSEDEIIKEKIFTACRERFLKEGFAKTSIDEISADLAISKKTFYKYFASKEDLVQQIMERFLGNVRTNVERILISDKNAVEKLSEVIGMIASNAGQILPMFGQDIKKRIPQLWKHIEDFRRQRISEVITRLIKQGVAEGTMRPEMNHRVFLMSVLSTIDGVIQPHILAEESFSLSDALKEVISIFFNGALTEQGREQFKQLHS